MAEELSYNDVLQYQHLFTKTPAFVLEMMAKKNSNVVKKFEPAVRSYLNRLNDTQKKKLDLILVSDVDDLQAIMQEAYQNTNKKQFKILANPKYKKFIQQNIAEVEKLM